MRILVAPQEFKGSLAAVEAAEALAVGIRAVAPDALVEALPLSDGGPGLVDALLAAVGGERVVANCHDPLGRPIRASFGVGTTGIGVIEMAAASGLTLLTPAERDPLRATTTGTGELILAALDRGCGEIIVGVGGSATVDAGAGALAALGARLLGKSRAPIADGGGSLRELDHIDLAGVDPRLSATGLRVASDVRNALCGSTGAAVMFGPQKGASPDDVQVLDAGLQRFAEVARRDCGVDVMDVPGGGAAGGLAAGLMLCGATIEGGFDLVASVCGLEARIAAADLVVTGEGRLDEQTPFGKTAWGVAEIARRVGTPVGVVAGVVDATFTRADMFDFIEQASPPDMAPEQAMAQAAQLVADAAGRVVSNWMRQAG